MRHMCHIHHHNRRSAPSGGDIAFCRAAPAAPRGWGDGADDEMGVALGDASTDCACECVGVVAGVAPVRVPRARLREWRCFPL